MAANERFDVIVVGAGASGIAAATELQDTERVLLLEASDQVGGRCRSVPIEGEDRAVDLGAHYFGKDHRALMQLVETLGLQDQLIDYVPTFGEDPSSVFRIGGQTVTTRRSQTYFQIQGVDATAGAWDQLRFGTSLLTVSFLGHCVHLEEPWRTIGAQKLDAVSFGDFVRAQALPAWFSDLMYSGVRAVLGQDPERMSLLYVLWYIRSNGGFSRVFNDQEGAPQQYGLRCGLGGLLCEWLRRFSGRVELGCAAKRIVSDAGGVTVHTADGRCFEADRVIITVPLATCRNLEFEPPVCAERQALFEQPAGWVVKAVIEYPEPWWRSTWTDKQQVFAYLNGHGIEGVDWILTCDDPERGVASMVCFVLPQWIDSAPDRSPEGIKSRVAEAVHHCTEDPRALEFSRMHVCDWREQPFALGGPNTNFAPGALTKGRRVFGRPEHDRVYFAGAEMSPWFTGYVEGAVRSGRAVARQSATSAARPPVKEGVAWAWAIGQATLLLPLYTVIFAATHARTVFARVVQLVTGIVFSISAVLAVQPEWVLKGYGLRFGELPPGFAKIADLLASGWGTGYLIIGLMYLLLSRRLWGIEHRYASLLAIAAMVGSFHLNQKMGTIGLVSSEMVRQAFAVDSLIIGLNGIALLLSASSKKGEPRANPG